MKRLNIFIPALAVVLFLGCAPAFAQRPSTAGKPPSAGPGVGPGTGPSATPHGNTSPANPGTASPSSPSSVLSRNTSLGPALVKALGKQDITVPGGNLATFCSSTFSFKTLGQCIAALHINHKFPSCSFTDLSSSTKGLGQAIKGCNPHVDPKVEAKKATKQANADIKGAKS